ncbi:mRNA decay activator protein ZFP36L1 isoform X2 [Denticeps clupeoides]|uniref:mRNA decay activator protein ZFP36L1 isoform X2 n=1 Tax=Denticeps clupeoides TaxID=299321 RepID=UPI0010A49D60|nr:mRNA decay activator protein ZFP36L1-like isoform X2 [Denticeps clupeoides]
MPSYALNHLIDLDEVLCKLLSLDLREPPKSSPLPLSPIGQKKLRSHGFSSSDFVFPGTSRAGAPASSGHWKQHGETSLPPGWNKTSFWSERSVSMVEGSTGGLGWASAEPGATRQASGGTAASVPTSSGAAPSTSSRYKTELCRTFAERGICKYGEKCQFAHGPEELRDLNRHPKYKTEPCRTFHSIGFCPYGIRCHFVHNNEDDHAHGRPQAGAPAAAPRPHPQRPPLLRHSYSFAGFPSNPAAPDPPLSSAFLRVPSSEFSDLLLLAFPDMEGTPDAGRDPQPHFLPSPDSGCGLTPTFPSPPQAAPTPLDGCLRRSPAAPPALVSRSLSHTSLSDHEGGCGSSASSQSGSDSCASGYEGAGRRLPIFSQLSVPDDAFCGESGGPGGGTSFFL